MARAYSKTNFIAPLSITLQKALQAGIVLGVIVFLVGLSLFMLNNPSGTKEYMTSPVAVASTKELPSKINFTPELHIANNGLVLVRSAYVVSISDSTTMHVEIKLNGIVFDWLVKTNDLSKFLNAKGGPVVSPDIHVGSVLTVIGQLMSGGVEPTINAQFVRILQ